MHLGYIELEKVCISVPEILRLFVNIWLPTTSIPLAMCTISRNKSNVSQKQKAFSGFFIAFLKCAWNLEHFEKKDEYPSLIISETMDCERGGYLNV